MAFDGYRSPPPLEQPAYYDFTNPRPQPSPVHNQTEAQRARRRGSSQIWSDGNMSEGSTTSSRTRIPQQPIREAVSSAVDGSESSSQVPPELIAQITENVLKQLKSVGLESGTSIPQPQPQPQPQYSPPPAQAQAQQTYPPPPVQSIPNSHYAPPSVQAVPLSPSTHSGSSPQVPTRDVYTPPSPHKNSEYHSRGSPRSPQETPVSMFNDRGSTPPPSDGGESDHNRPKGPIRLSTGKEETTLERIWGQLFNEEGCPTARLGQFLRGLAVHIIEDNEPRHSIVVTPRKMQQYFDDVKLSTETYPWHMVFDDDRSNISRMYRDLECQHHLVQDRLDERPDIPGLTTLGFERLVTLLIQANPEEEYKRLQKAVLDMPINNPDDKKERFPKELSRRLFPRFEDRNIRERIEKAIVEHAKVEIPKRTVLEGPSSQQPEHQNPIEPATAPPQIERERKPYATIPTDSAVDDSPPTALPQPIERERKPYSSCGKTYDDDLRAREADPRPREPVKTAGGRTYEEEMRAREAAKPRRSNSNASRARPVSMNPGALPSQEIPTRHYRTLSNSRRHRSPSFSGYGRSDGDLHGDPRGEFRAGYPTPFQPSSIPADQLPPAPPPQQFDGEDPRRFPRDFDVKRSDSTRRRAEDDVRHKGENLRDRARYDGTGERKFPSRSSTLSEEDYYRGARGANGYDYQQPYGGPTYR